MNKQLRAHQLMLLSMLHDLDAVCEKHRIPYALFAGSALGAVRHRGFIPWDDDLDVIMLRGDYERFLQVAPKEMDQEKYFVQTEFSEHWPCHFSKLRRNNTACIERTRPKDKLQHQGVYIDIFPCDNLSDRKVVRKLQFFASKIVIAKALSKRGYLTDSGLKKLFMLLTKLVPMKPMKKLAQLRKAETTQMVHSFFGASKRFEKSIYPREWFTETERLPFEDGLFPVSKEYDRLLTTLYGDYMTPIPDKDRGVKVHAEIVDLENSYETYLDVQENLQFTEYTRSIR